MRLFQNLRVNKVINDKNRISSVDFFRSIAIISVLIFHFNGSLPYGYLGVDLFFVISGLLIGGLLTRDFKEEKPIEYAKFIVSRGLKIWPSYYFWLFIGNIICYFLYKDSHPDMYIPLWDLKRYLFFYQNYTGVPIRPPFENVWSLCVEEHFYLILPVMFILIQKFIFKKQVQIKTLFNLTIMVIILGLILKNCSFYFTRSKDTFMATHNKIDTLAFGVLLSLIITYYGERIKKIRYLPYLWLIGLGILSIAIYVDKYFDIILYHKIYFRFVVSASFFIILLSLYYIDFSNQKILRIIAYYSYNLYLWHSLFPYFIFDNFGVNIISFIIYITLSFSCAFLATVFIEESVLSKRKSILNKLFTSKTYVPKTQMR